MSFDRPTRPTTATTVALATFNEEPPPPSPPPRNNGSATKTRARVRILYTAVCLDLDTLSWIVKFVALAEIITNAGAALLSTAAFFYNLVNCNSVDVGHPEAAASAEGSAFACGLIANVTEGLELELSSHVGAFMLVSCLVHIIIGVILFDAASTRSVKKCQLAFILATGQWLLGMLIFISVVESNQLAIFTFLIFFTLKFLYLVVIRTYKNRLIKNLT